MLMTTRRKHYAGVPLPRNILQAAEEYKYKFGRNKRPPNKKGYGNGNSRSVTLPPIMRRTLPKSTEITRSRSASARRKKPNDKRWYDDGYPALREADKKIRTWRQENADMQKKTQERFKQDLHNKLELLKRKEKSNITTRLRTRSLSRGRSSRRSKRSLSVGDRSMAGSGYSTPRRQEQINLTYTGDVTRSNSQAGFTSRPRSRRNSGSIVHKKVKSVVPYMREGYTINRLQARIFQEIQKTYDTKTTDRQSQFYDRLAKIQLEHYRMKYMKLKDKDKQILDEKFKQFEKLRLQMRKYENSTSFKYMSQRDNSHMIEAKFHNIASKDLTETVAYYNNKHNKYNQYASNRIRPVRGAADTKPYKMIPPVPKNYYEKYALPKRKPGSGSTKSGKDPQKITVDIQELMKEAEQMIDLCDDSTLKNALMIKDKSGKHAVMSYIRQQPDVQRLRAPSPLDGRTIQRASNLQARQKLNMQSRSNLANRNAYDGKRATYHYGRHERNKIPTLAK